MLATTALADQVQKPARMRVNRGLVDLLLHNGDQKMLEAWTDIQIDEPAKSADERVGLSDLTFSILPKNVDIDDYDFTLSLKDPEHDGFFGVIGKDLMVKGTATGLDSSPIEWWADVSRFSLEVGESKETEEVTLALNRDAIHFELGVFDF